VAASRQQKPVEEAEHRAWLTAALRDPAIALYVAWDSPGGPAAGTVRIDHRQGTICEVSLTVAPEARGCHMAQWLIKAAVEANPYRCENWVAEVRRENIASLRAFLSVGWLIYEYNRGFVRLEHERVPEKAPVHEVDVSDTAGIRMDE